MRIVEEILLQVRNGKLERVVFESFEFSQVFTSVIGIYFVNNRFKIASFV